MRDHVKWSVLIAVVSILVTWFLIGQGDRAQEPHNPGAINSQAVPLARKLAEANLAEPVPDDSQRFPQKPDEQTVSRAQFWESTFVQPGPLPINLRKSATGVRPPWEEIATYVSWAVLTGSAPTYEEYADRIRQEFTFPRIVSIQDGVTPELANGIEERYQAELDLLLPDLVDSSLALRQAVWDTESYIVRVDGQPSGQYPGNYSFIHFEGYSVDYTLEGHADPQHAALLSEFARLRANRNLELESVGFSVARH